jgi:formate/nitrite transporter FocA (FNT family)
MQQQPTYTLNNLTEKEVKLIGESRAPKSKVKFNLIGFGACIFVSLILLFILSVMGQTGNRYSDLSLIPLALSLIFMAQLMRVKDKAGKVFLEQIRHG